MLSIKSTCFYDLATGGTCSYRYFSVDLTRTSPDEKYGVIVQYDLDEAAFVVICIKQGSLVDIWNRRTQSTFPSDQLLPADVIMRVNGISAGPGSEREAAFRRQIQRENEVLLTIRRRIPLPRALSQSSGQMQQQIQQVQQAQEPWTPAEGTQQRETQLALAPTASEPGPDPDEPYPYLHSIVFELLLRQRIFLDRQVNN